MRVASSACVASPGALLGPSVRYPPMAPERLFVASADGHVGIPTPEYRDYLDPEYREPFTGFLAEHIQRWSAAEPTSVLDPAAWDWWQGKERYESGGIDSLFDPERRVKELDHDGVAVEVLFADDQNENTAPWLGGGLVQVGLQKEYSSELRMAGARAYNRWLAEFCSVRARPLHRRDRDAHARRRRRRGRRSAARPRRRPAPQRAAPARLRAARAPPEERAVLGRVLRARPHHRRPPRRRLTALGRRRRVGLRDRDHGDVLLRAPPALVHGVRRRARTPPRPARGVHRVGRRLGAGHASCRWTASPRAACGAPANEQPLAHLPSEQFHRQCFVANSIMQRREIDMRDAIGTDILIWGSDFGHHEGQWPTTRERMHGLFEGVPEADVRKIVGDNFLRAYKVDRAALRPARRRDRPHRRGPRCDLTRAARRDVGERRPGPDISTTAGSARSRRRRRHRLRSPRLASVDGRIVAVGGDGGPRARRPRHRARRLHGAIVVPGFIETHMHPMLWGQLLANVHVGPTVCPGVDDVVAAIAEAGVDHADGDPVRAWGFDDTLVQEDRELDRASTSTATSRHPVMVLHVSGHSAYANSAPARAGRHHAEIRGPGGRTGAS